MPGWYNAGFGNMYSMDWIYDDWTIELFKKETGIQVFSFTIIFILAVLIITKVPGNATAENRFTVRYDFLTGRDNNVRWKVWRYGKIVTHFKNILSRIRK